MDTLVPIQSGIGSGGFETVHNAVTGTKNLSSYLNGWTNTSYSSSTVERVRYWNSQTSANILTKRGLNHTGAFNGSQSYAFRA